MSQSFNEFREHVVRDLAVQANLERANSVDDVVRLGLGLGFRFDAKDVVAAMSGARWSKPEVIGDELDRVAAVPMMAYPPSNPTDTQTDTWAHCYGC